MNATPKEMLDTMLGHLGFTFEIKEFETPNGITLQIYSLEKNDIIGRRGEGLEDLQLLLNRMIQTNSPQSPRIVVDCEHYREMKDDSLLQKVRQLAETVRKTGRSCHLEPMNSYQRRLVHNMFKDDPEVQSWSPENDSRIKQITLKARSPQSAPENP